MQNIWDKYTNTAQWTKTLISNSKNLILCKNRRTDSIYCRPWIYQAVIGNKQMYIYLFRRHKSARFSIIQDGTKLD